jgi:hypothetical protein
MAKKQNQTEQKEENEYMNIGIFEDSSIFNDIIPDIMPLPKPKSNHQDQKV